MSREEEGFCPALALLRAAAAAGDPVIAAVDGRCGSGKTALARLAERELGCPVVHMDDYYLPFQKRVVGWERTPGANMDLIRLRLEVLEPFRAGRAALYRPYDCRMDAFGRENVLPAGGLLLVEGSYSHHPGLADLYGERIFLTCDAGTQRRRLMEREGAHFAAFESRWIPLEEAYIRAYSIGADCTVIDTTHFF